jgi:hypothetical protein
MAQGYQFTTDPTQVELQAIARRRRMAEMLQQQGAEPLQTNRMAGGYVVPISPTEGLAKIAQAWASGKIDRDADTQTRQIGEQMAAERADTLRRAMQAGQGTPAVNPMSATDALPGEPMQVPARAGSPQAMYEVLMGSRDPSLQQAGMAAIMQSMAPKAPIALGKDQRLVTPTGAEVVPMAAPQPKMQRVEIPDGRGGVRVGFVDTNSPNPMATFQEGGAQPPKPDMVNTGGQIVPVNPYTQTQPINVTAAPGAVPFAASGMTPDEYRQHQQNVAASGATRVNVPVNTERTFYGEMAQKVGGDVSNAATQARAAVGTIGTLNQIRDAIATGRVIAGPGASTRQFLGQVGQVIGAAGRDSTEQLVQTQKVIQGLAQLELDAAQQLRGQGQITEGERDILRRAASGEIDKLSVPELTSLMSVLDRSARSKITGNQRNVEMLRQNPSGATLIPFMSVDMPPEWKPPQQGTQAPTIPPPPPGFNLVPQR